MNINQLKILVGIAVFLLFDLLVIFSYQKISGNLNKAEENSKELIGTFNVALDSASLGKLAEKINPAGAGEKNNPAIVFQEPLTDIKLEDLRIIILNGNGVEGNAGFAEELLSKNSYKIQETKNADRNDYSQTTIIFHSQAEKRARDLQTILKSYYNDVVLLSIGKETKTIEIILGSPL